MSPAAAHILIPLIVAVSILLMLIRPRGIAEVWWVGSGALLLVLLRLIPASLAGHAIAEGTDVYLFLVGMMLLSELAREQGVFDWLSSTAIRNSHGSCAHLFTLVYGIGILVTVFLSNDATAVVLTPAILAAVRKAKVPPLPYLFACAFIANAASFVLPISNPANLVVFRLGMPPLGRWLLAFGVPSLLSIATTYLVLRWLFRSQLALHLDEDPGAAPLSHNGKIVLTGLALVIVVLLAASSLHMDLGLPTCLTALAVTGAISIKEKLNPSTLAKEISWATIALVAALFILVDALESIGALRFSHATLAYAASLPPAAGAMLTSFAVGIANNLINNLPLGLIAASTLHSAHSPALLTNAVLIGVDLGPNLSVTGSLATILWLIALRREQVNVSFIDFLRVGAIAMPAALLAATAGSILMNWFARAS